MCDCRISSNILTKRVVRRRVYPTGCMSFNPEENIKYMARSEPRRVGCPWCRRRRDDKNVCSTVEFSNLEVGRMALAGV